MTEASCENPQEHCDLYACQLQDKERNPDIRYLKSRSMCVPTVSQKLTKSLISVDQIRQGPAFPDHRYLL